MTEMTTFLLFVSLTFLFLSVSWMQDTWLNVFLKMWFTIMFIVSVYFLTLEVGIVIVRN